MANPIIPLDYPNLRLPGVAPQTGFLERHISRLLTDIVRRLGGQREDHVREARAAALETQAMTLAVLRGVTTGYYHTPAHPLTYTSTSETAATITIAAHTRSTASATIAAGTVTGVTRGAVNYVYYDDAGNAGGTVTFYATTSVASLTTAGRKVVDAIFVEGPPPSPGA